MGDTAKFRMYHIDEAGRIRREEFGYQSDRTMYQTWIAQNVGNAAMGHFTELNYAYPSLYFPFTWPLGTGFIGFLMLIFGVRRVNPWI